MSRVTRKLLYRFGISKTDKDESTSAASDLDEEMEKVFAMSEEDKFDLTSLSAADQKTFTGRRKFSEQDYDHAHRKRSYPHTHIPLKPCKAHSSKKDVFIRESSKKTSPPSISIDEKIGQTPNGADRQIAADEEIGELVAKNRCEGKDRIPTIHNNDEPLISERAAAEPCRESTSPDRKVQFDVGSPETSNQEDQLNNNLADDRQISFGQDRKLKRKHSGHHHKKPRRRTHTNGEAARSTSKDENADDGSYQFILQLEEPLDEFIQDDLTSHRFDFGKDKRRFSTKSNISSILTHRRGNESSIISSLPIKLDKKAFDHSPHEVFVQLDELSGIGEEREWKETARWIKYEEDVEVGADRWGKPHVASLSFHSLLNLRRCLENGVILLDMEEKELPAIAYRVVERMAVEELIKEEDKAVVMRSLLLKHRHVHEHDRFRFIRKNNSSYSSLQNLNEECKKTKFSVTSYDLSNTLKAFSNHEDKLGHTVIDMKEETTYSSSSEDISKKMIKERESILKRIPVGAEATTVLIGTVEFLRQPTTAFVRLAEAIHLSAVTEVSIPVRFMFILLGPPNTDVDYYEIGRSISTLMSNTDFNKKAYKAAKRKDLLSAINEFLDYSIVVPPGNWEREALLSLRELKAKNEAIRRRRSRTFEPPFPAVSEKLISGEGKKGHFDDDPLHRTKKPFGGLINDLKRRYPYYKSDFLDGINCLCISAAIFMYFAALSAAITFGGLIAGKTKNLIGISETLVATSIAGIIFALCSAQPLLIIGTTGPLLLFDESLFTFCLTHNIDYLTMRVYVGIWLFIIAIFVACVEGSVFIKVFTRFTEEIFSSLISLIYIFESIMSCITVFKKHPLLPIKDYCDINNSTTPAKAPTLPSSEKHHQPNTALFCTILSLGTFFLAYYLRHFRNSKFLGRSARRALGDFGVPIAIVVMGALAALNTGTYIEKLSVPEGLSPSAPDERGWLISPLGSHGQFQVWAMLIACIPAILVYILLFMETNISELIIGKKERKLQKGNGFHLDITLVCLTNVVCGLIGAPWMCAATVRSVTHVSSVTVMSRTHAPGEKPHIMEVKEQRVSSLLVSIMVGLSVMMARYLSLVPMAVLFGVFLYMGISSINGVQFFERLKLLLMPVKHHPEVAYVRRVRTFKMHLFTLIQLFCLILLWTIKSSPIALTLPFFLLLMVPLRSQLKYIFLPQELRALDSEEPDAIDKEDDDEPDFYVESVLPS